MIDDPIWIPSTIYNIGIWVVAIGIWYHTIKRKRQPRWILSLAVVLLISTIIDFAVRQSGWSIIQSILLAVLILFLTSLRISYKKQDRESIQKSEEQEKQ